MAITFNAVSSTEGAVTDALKIAQAGGDDIKSILDDIQPDSKINDIGPGGSVIVVGGGTLPSSAASGTQYVNYVSSSEQYATTPLNGGLEVANRYGYDLNTPIIYNTGTIQNPAWHASGYATVDISQASGAMVIDDLMQKISTKVQVAAQMLAATNNIQKTASRILSQG